MPPASRRGVGCSCRVSGAGASPWPRLHARPGERSRRKKRGTKLVVRGACAWPRGSGRRHGFRRSAERKAPVRERGDGGGTGEAADEGGRSPRRAGAAGGDGRRQAHGAPETGRRDGTATRAAETAEACRDGSGGCPEARAGAGGGEAAAGGGKAAAAILRRLAAASDPPRLSVKGGLGGFSPQATGAKRQRRGGRKLAISARYRRAWPAQRAGGPARIRPLSCGRGRREQRRTRLPKSEAGSRGITAPVQAAGRAGDSRGALAGNAGVCKKTEPLVCHAAGGAFPARYPAGVRRRWVGLGALSVCLDPKLPLGSAVAEP